MSGNVAGQVIQAGRMSGEIIASVEYTSDSATFTTTETDVMTLSASLINGDDYWIIVDVGFSSTVADDIIRAHLYSGTSGAGTEIDASLVQVADAAVTRAFATVLRSKFTATSTGSQVFTVSAERVSGTGTCNMEGSSNRRNTITVEHD